MSELENQNLKLQLEMLIFGSASEVAINIRTGALNVTKNGRISDLQIVSPIGGKNLSRDYDKTTKIVQRIVHRDKPPHSSGRTELVTVGEMTGWKSVAANMSNILPISENEIKALVEPFLMQGFQKLFVFTACNEVGLNNSIDCETRYGLKNCWKCAGSIPNNDWVYVNSLLKARKSNLRIRTSRTFVTRVLGEDT